jgi:hypothetical protein
MVSYVQVTRVRAAASVVTIIRCDEHKAIPGASRYLGRYTRTFGLFGRKRGQKKSPTIVGLLFVRIFSCLHLDKQSLSTT